MKTKTKYYLPVFALFALACLPLSAAAQGVCLEGCDLSNGSTFLGEDALISHTSGAFFNTAVGKQAGHGIIAGASNSAFGAEALSQGTGGSFNTAIGAQALLFTGGVCCNTAIGESAMYNNLDGYDNTATGKSVLFFSQHAILNTVSGAFSLFFNSTGNANTAMGAFSLYRNTTGSINTAIGYEALVRNETGSNNIALGDDAGFNLIRGDNNIYIGNAGVDGDHNKIRIGTVDTQKATFIAGISGVTVPAGVGVIVGIDGKLGTVVSSERFKDSIKPLDKASEAILALKPVMFRYKNELDPKGIPQFGLVAEDVEKVNPDLVARDEQGKPYTVRYEAVNAMLLNEFLKEHRKVQELEANAVQQQRNFAEQQKQIAVLTTGLQKVSAQLELSKSVPQTVLNNQ